MSSERIQVGPKPGLLAGMCEQNLEWKHVFGELIDNALDKQAKSIRFEFGRATPSGGASHLTVRDDGLGSDNLLSFVVYGDHKPDPRVKRRLGIWGCGFKDAALWAGGLNSKLDVESIRDAKVRRLFLKWAELAASSDWTIGGDQLEGPEDTKLVVHGTKVVIATVIRRVPEGKRWDELLDYLGYMYTPALRDGAQILFQSKKAGSEPVALKPQRLPPLEDGFVDRTIDVGGRIARVYVGIVKSGAPNPRPGITYFREFRVIQEASSKGCAPYGIANIAGAVQLVDGWTLAKNKDAIGHAEELYAAVFDVCKEVLAKAETAAQLLESASIVSEVESTINGLLVASGEPNAKAKRGKGKKSGSVQPTGTGGKHKRADEEQEGRTFTRGLRGGGIRLQVMDLPEERGVGYYEDGGSVLLAKNNPCVAAIIRDKDRRGLAQLAIAIIANWAAIHPQDKKGRFLIPGIGGDPTESFSRIMAALLANASVNGSPVLSTTDASGAFPANGSAEKN